MIQFYAPDILETGFLPESDSAHCCRVLRMHAGEEVFVVNGKGKRYRCVIMEAHPRHTAIEIIGEEDLPSHWGFHLTLAVAPTKNTDRMEWLLEKVVEIGVDSVVFLRCAHSERKVIKPERLEKVMVAAMKQSLKGVLPELHSLVPFSDFVKMQSDKDSFRCMGYCSDQFERKNFAQLCPKGRDVVIMIGPEGDFSQDEVNEAVKAGFVPVTFGESRLRTETAALYGVAAAHVVNSL